MEFYVVLVLLGAALVFTGTEGHAPPRCLPVECEPPCFINQFSLPCPSCECIQCSLPRCQPPCWINFSTVPCASCECEGSDAVQCTLPRCPRGCVIDLDTRPCPICACNVNSTS
ncbi:hypothetical protein AVEN_157930-1 [Araneus ventricosus]|uniref:Antistasin-like domain-containing protein n=1 Tax=Araneus ventricosus TaxID=182803 RepID=A0A4Y2HAI3_ARAVE|nr:hypothetical protein AVEN_157930-1 [Araneus ventricosus]